VVSGSSFETQTASAPQDEGGEVGRDEDVDPRNKFGHDERGFQGRRSISAGMIGQRLTLNVELFLASHPTGLGKVTTSFGLSPSRVCVTRFCTPRRWNVKRSAGQLKARKAMS
jgi:hypothetical protein